MDHRGEDSTVPDPFDLSRFVEAQRRMYAIAAAELESGTKESHWMWYIFPQHRKLGFSPKATLFGIASLEEARAYLGHPVLAPRLQSCTLSVMSHADRSIAAIFGSPDDMKFRSSMTLFAAASPEGIDGPSPFRSALDARCGGEADPRTLDLLARSG